MFKRLLFATLFAIVLWMGLLSNTASSQQVESRINNLEADLNRVRSQLNQIQSQMGQTRLSPSPRTTLTPRQPSRNLSQTERDKMFDRLATLVIELRQQVNKLETRVSQLEKR